MGAVKLSVVNLLACQFTDVSVVRNCKAQNFMTDSDTDGVKRGSSSQYLFLG